MGSRFGQNTADAGLSRGGVRLGVQAPSRQSRALLRVSAEFQRKLIKEAKKERRSLTITQFGHCG